MKTAEQRARVLLFAYGTLLDARVQRRVFGREVATVAARLAGWRVKQRFVRGRYPGILPAVNETISGGVLKITAAELARADAYENAPRLYRRQRVTAKVASKAVRCWVYVPASMSSNR